jgi:hypothetical protein
MSKNLAQVYAVNPVTTIGSTDLLYVDVTATTDGAITGANLKALFASSTLTSAYLYVGNASNVATGVALSGDASLSNAGAITVSKIGGVGITLGGAFTTSGAFTVTQTYTANTSVTFPTSGTLATTSQLPSWVDETGSSVTMTTNTGYTSDDGATLVTFTLPTTSAIGDFVEVNGKGSGGWTIAQATGQQIHMGSSTTTSGSSGSLSSSNQYDCVRLRCLTANTIWTVVSVQGNLTVV